MWLRLRLKCHLQLAFGAAVATDNNSDRPDPAHQGPLEAQQDLSLQTQAQQPESVIDATGLICPLPLLKLKQALHHLAAGDTLVMSVDDLNSVRDSERFCAKLGYEFRAKPDHEQRTICHLWVTKPVR